MPERFSRRNRYTSPDAEITVREDAPLELRSAVVDIAYESGAIPSALRDAICRALRIAVDPGNWSEFPNIDIEVRESLSRCEWFEVYDAIEEISISVEELEYEQFEDSLNDYFRRRGIGWQLAEGMIEIRGAKHFESTLRGALDATEDVNHETAHGELHEALQDLSRRPHPDVTGAIQHAMAALECMVREITGDRNSTLGKIIKDHPTLIPRPLDQAVEKAWGYASNRGRHLQEASSPEYEDAELVVSIAGAVCSYLMHKEGHSS